VVRNGSSEEKVGTVSEERVGTVSGWVGGEGRGRERIGGWGRGGDG
jgi:hypothetical protein